MAPKDDDSLTRKVLLASIATGILAAAVAGCTSGGHGPSASGAPTTAGRTTSTTITAAERLGSTLLPLIIKEPFDYEVAPTAGATGTITPAAFGKVGGDRSAAQSGYVTGYRQNYVSSETGEGISITILKFRSRSQASAYLNATANDTLALVDPKIHPFVQIPGATELDGTKAYQGQYESGVVMSHNEYYASVVYVTAQPVTLPMEFYDWAKVQYENLK